MHLKDYLFLFDIDGTIMDTKGLCKNAFIDSFEESVGKKVNTSINFLGGVDNLIFKDLFNSLKIQNEDYDKLWNNFKNIYSEKLSGLKLEKSMLMENVAQSIKYLNKHSNIGLVTGNIKKCAFIKLKLFGLDKYFECGGFGDSAADRSDLVFQAITDSSRLFKKNFNNNKIILFGDTKKDVDSAADNSIISFLIDPKMINKSNISSWKPNFYGTFKDFDNLLKLLNNCELNMEKTVIF